MKKAIKLFIFIQILLLSILVISSKNRIYASEITDSSSYYENCNNSVQLFPEVIELFKNNQVTRSVNSSSIYTNNYAGSFIDGNGILNVGYLQSVNFSSYGDQVQYIQREFSYNYLLEVKDTISEIMIEYDVYMVGIDEEENEVDVYVASQSIANNIIAYLQEVNLYDEDAIHFNIDSANCVAPTSKIAYGGDKINDSILFFEGSYGTICVNAYDNETGKYGILTNAHVAEANMTMYHNGNVFQGDKIGVATKRQNSGTIDAAFVPFDKQNKWEVTTDARYENATFNNIRLGSEELIIQGAPVIKLGQTSGYTQGKILSTNLDCSILYGTEEVIIKNTIKYSNQSLSGDSGGPVYYDGGGENVYLIAMNFAGPRYDSFTFGIGCTIFNVMSELNITPILSGTIFDTTNLENNEIRIDKLVPTIPSQMQIRTEFEIPSYINGRTVTEIGDSAFANQFNISKFILPTNLRTIGNSAFKGCGFLQEITIPDTVTDIGANAFEDCFYIENITLPMNLLTIGNAAFKGWSSLKTITIPNSVTRIGYEAFALCDNLTSITLPFIGEKNNNTTHNYFGYIFGATSGTENGSYVPSKLKEVTVTGNASIADAAFQNCVDIERIVLSNMITSIGDSACSGCSKLTSITMPNSVTYIGSNAFENCNKLTNVTVSTGLLEVGDYVFKNCTNLSTIVLPNTLTIIGKGMFENCTALTNITLPNALTTIDSNAFSGCSNLESITIPEIVTSIGENAFKNCGNLSSITLPESVEHVGAGAFQNCEELDTVIVQREISQITSLGTYVFEGCKTTLQIVVPMYRLAEYKNKANWSTYASKIGSNSTNYDTIDMHCLSNFNRTTELEARYNKLYRLEVECGKSYTITSTSNQAIQMDIYNSAMQLIYHTPRVEGTNCQKVIQEYLGKGTYYLSVSFLDETSSGIIQTNYKLTWPGTGLNVYYNKNNYVHTHLHQTGENKYQNQLVYNHNKGAGVYKVTLTGTAEDGTTVFYPEGAIQIYSDQNRTTLIDKFSLTGYDIQAKTKQGENSMIICLLQNTTLYITVEMTDNTCTTLNFTITPVEVEEINLFDLSESTDTAIPIFAEEQTKGDQFKRLNVKELGKFELSIEYSGYQTSEILVVLTKLNYNSTSNSYTLSTKRVELINGENNTSVRTIVLEEGIYYIGYFNKNDSADIDIELTRKISQSGSGLFKVDPDQSTASGSQINIVERDKAVSERSYGSNVITVGFTRLIYINHLYGISQSRLDYNWYSSNENIATVSAYGTVLGKQAGTVKIMAVLKTDPSKTFVKEFTIIEDTGTEEVIIENLYKVNYNELENGKFHLDIEKLNCPYPWIQDYIWDIVIPTTETNLTAEMDAFGYITVNQTGTFTIIGEYTRNSRFKVLITIVVE